MVCSGYSCSSEVEDFLDCGVLSISLAELLEELVLDVSEELEMFSRPKIELVSEIETVFG